MEKAIFNIETLEAWKQIDSQRWQKLVTEILDIFLSTGVQQYNDLKKASQLKNWNEVKASSHMLKSGCGNVGAEACFFILNNIEALSVENPELVTEQIEKLEPLFLKTIATLTEYRNQFQAA